MIDVAGGSVGVCRLDESWLPEFCLGGIDVDVDVGGVSSGLLESSRFGWVGSVCVIRG